MRTVTISDELFEELKGFVVDPFDDTPDLVIGRLIAIVKKAKSRWSPLEECEDRSRNARRGAPRQPNRSPPPDPKPSPSTICLRRKSPSLSSNGRPPAAVFGRNSHTHTTPSARGAPTAVSRRRLTCPPRGPMAHQVRQPQRVSLRIGLYAGPGWLDIGKQKQRHAPEAAEWRVPPTKLSRVREIEEYVVWIAGSQDPWAEVSAASWQSAVPPGVDASRRRAQTIRRP